MGLKTKKIAIILLIIFYSVSIATKGDAAWNGPTEILSGGWGNEVGLFGINYGDSGDQFPNMVVISSSGKILIGDSINKRIQVFNADGIFSNFIISKGFPTSYPAVTQWPLSLFICGDSSIYTRRNEYLQIYSLNGELQQNFTTIRGGIAFIDQQCNFYTYNPSANLYYLYSPTGQLIKTSETRPLELGVVSEKATGNGNRQNKVTVKYPEKECSYNAVGPMESYLRDKNGNLYGYGDTQVIRYTACGKELAALFMPEKKITEVSRGEDAEPKSTILEAYGSPVIARNGDVYTWKRTPDKYSILKWIWVDDPSQSTGPDAPTGLSLMPSTTGLYLTWTASPNDPGCVTGYEVARATTAGGTGSTVATVNAGTVKYNDTTATAGTIYYYKVRAVAGSEYSLNTSEVSGKR